MHPPGWGPAVTRRRFRLALAAAAVAGVVAPLLFGLAEPVGPLSGGLLGVCVFGLLGFVALAVRQMSAPARPVVVRSLPATPPRRPLPQAGAR